jgi:hypothetical protein
VTDKPVSTIINTPHHGDHTGSQRVLRRHGGDHRAGQHQGEHGEMDAFKGDKAQFLPKKTYKDKLSIGSGKEKIDLYYFGAGTPTATPSWCFGAEGDARRGHVRRKGHAAGPTARRRQRGAILQDPGQGGLQHQEGGGRSSPAHSPLMTWKDFTEFTAFHKDLLAWITAQHKAGKSVDEAADAYKVPDKYQGYTVRREGFGAFKQTVQTYYDELAAKSAPKSAQR